MPLSEARRKELEDAARARGVNPAAVIAAAERIDKEQSAANDEASGQRGGPAVKPAETPQIFAYMLGLFTCDEVRASRGYPKAQSDGQLPALEYLALHGGAPPALAGEQSPSPPVDPPVSQPVPASDAELSKKTIRNLVALMRRLGFDPGQPREDDGKWTDGPGGGGGSGGAKHPTRAGADKAVGKSGLINRDETEGRPGAGQVEYVPMDTLEGAAGYHDWDGKIVMAEETRALVEEFEAHVEAGTVSEASLPAAVAYQLLVHETIHGTSPIEPHAYVGSGVLIEETMVEIASRRVMREEFGRTDPEFEIPSTPDGGGYDPVIVGVVGAVASTAGLEYGQAARRVESASFAMRRNAKLKKAADPKEYMEMFAKHVGLAGKHAELEAAILGGAQ